MKNWQSVVSLLVFVLMVLVASPVMASSLESNVLQLVNAERIAAGCQPLTIDNQLMAAADIRSSEAGAVFAHQRPDGSSVKSVLQGASYSHFGENLAASQSVNAHAVVAAWMQSPTHRANILNRHYTKMGVSCTMSADGHVYWAQEFACD